MTLGRGEQQGSGRQVRTGQRPFLKSCPEPVDGEIRERHPQMGFGDLSDY